MAEDLSHKMSVPQLKLKILELDSVIQSSDQVRGSPGVKKRHKFFARERMDRAIEEKHIYQQALAIRSERWK